VYGSKLAFTVEGRKRTFPISSLIHGEAVVRGPLTGFARPRALRWGNRSPYGARRATNRPPEG
jgi:hypothetical protein